jgi:hypothetical protein
MIEGSGAESGPIPLTNGSGSGSRRPKNIRIRNNDRRSTHKYTVESTVYLMPLHKIEELVLGPVDGKPLAMSL